MRPRLRTATDADDEALRTLMRATPLPGPVSVTLEREPSWRAGALAVERDWTVVGDTGAGLAGCGSRLVRRVWWRGEPAPTAYLGDLRLHPDWRRRGGWLLRKGYQMLAEESARDPVAVTWSAIFESNTTARGTLFGHRAGLPEYIDRGRLLCPGLFVRRGTAWPTMHGIEWKRGSEATMDEVGTFLTEQRRHRPLAPVHAPGVIDATQWPDLRAEDFLLARRGGALVATAAVWDVRAVRQVRVQSIHGVLRFARWPLGLLHRLSGWPSLPAPGEVLAAGYITFLAVRDADMPLAAALLRAARALAAERGLSFLFVCLHERDLLVPALRGLPGISANGRLCEVRLPGSAGAWPDEAPIIEPALL